MRSIALALLMLLPAHVAHAEITEAKVTGGVVSGVAENGISVFKGIPFAAPPVGDRRWQAPAPVTICTASDPTWRHPAPAGSASWLRTAA